jgi:hypothetical protein
MAARDEHGDARAMLQSTRFSSSSMVRVMVSGPDSHSRILCSSTINADARRASSVPPIKAANASTESGSAGSATVAIARFAAA